MTTGLLRWLAGGVHGAQAAVADLWWPRACAACGEAPLQGATLGGLCAECAATLEPLGPGCRTVSCARCAAPLPLAVDAADGRVGRAGPCHDCRRLHPAVSRIGAAFVYEGALALALLRLKWQGRDDLAAPLGRLLTPLLGEALRRCDVVTPVPLHPSRLRARGYNQAALLLTAGLGALPRGVPARPVVAGLLRRTLATTPARAHGPHARQQRVAGAFAVAARYQPVLRAGALRVLLVDDVVTTGATISACAAALYAGGAAAVEAVALLRASP